jgi:L-serine dehydratase
MLATLPVPLSVTDVFTIGVGPSSSHTVGPMRAAYAFSKLLGGGGPLRRLTCDLYGSLALTGKGHATDTAVLLGLSGWLPDTLDPQQIPEYLHRIRGAKALTVGGDITVAFEEMNDLRFNREVFLPGHPNALTFSAVRKSGDSVERTYYSVGGGTVVEKDAKAAPTAAVRVPLAFGSGAELLEVGLRSGLTIAGIVLENEAAWRPQPDTLAFLDRVRAAMFQCIDSGLVAAGDLPGPLKIRRRAGSLLKSLSSKAENSSSSVFEWVSLYALSVNEENAAGKRVVTAPTNGAAGVLPAVLKYYENFTAGANVEGSRTYLLTAAAMCFLYKWRASISAAAMGCQGEIGVACSMAAAGLTAALGGTNQQIENAAEIGMEHNLGLTCDPVGGLVQIPCIERNTMGAVKAINAAYLALSGDGLHVVSLDAVIETMRQTGEDMKTRYKETSLGGLAVNVTEC